jgi:hypothetical protein
VPLTAAGLSVASVLLAGCTGTGDSAPSSSPSPSATVSSSPSTDPQAAAKATVLAVYRKMWAAKTKAYATAKMPDDLAHYATDKALSNIKLTLIYYQDHGTVMKGEPKIAPKVTAISIGSPSSEATITDCVDASSYIEVYRKTGKPIDTANPTASYRYVMTAAARTVGGTWMITDTSIDRTSTC